MNLTWEQKAALIRLYGRLSREWRGMPERWAELNALQEVVRQATSPEPGVTYRTVFDHA